MKLYIPTNLYKDPTNEKKVWKLLEKYKVGNEDCIRLENDNQEERNMACKRAIEDLGEPAIAQLIFK
ncbi:hypothetical protein [Eubacterium limosum]|uniref:hypothetical protein n=1 Tax=Eubacterium limosum TaxID=1736 RepID=UPI001062AE99|nr:hypothetical protein [Eubacterium limosum]